MLALLALPALASGQARTSTCVDGTDCRCDTIASDPSIVFCEDFEDPALDVPGHLLTSGNGWSAKYGLTGSPGQCEGEDPGCWFNIVTQGRCHAASEGDCVFDGRQTLGHKSQPGESGGAIGIRTFSATPLKQWGITMAIRWSAGFKQPSFQNGHTGIKTDFVLGIADVARIRHLPFGGSEANYNSSRYPICSGNVYGNIGSNHPFASMYSIDCPGYDPARPRPCGAQRPTAVRGTICSNDVHLDFYPDPKLYQYGQTPGHRNGSWMCFQVHWTDFGNTRSRHRFWVNGVLVNDVADVDTSILRGAQARGIDSIAFDNYYNDFYDGTTIEYRYEDNIVVTTAGEPVPCSAIGFDGSYPTPGGIGAPGKPILVR